jgi:hypothetical protein
MCLCLIDTPPNTHTHTHTQRVKGDVSTARIKRNWLIHQLYVRQEFGECLSVVDMQLRCV